MAQELSLDEVKVLRSAFQASDIDGDGYLSREDLQTSSGLARSEDLETLFQGFKREEKGNLISFEEFAKGVMDFPFLLEQYREELKERRSIGEQQRDSGPVFNIDIIEEVDFPPANARFRGLGTIQENTPAEPVLKSQAMRQAYAFYSALLSHRSTLSWNGSGNEFRLENYVDMTQHLLEKLHSKYSSSPDKVRDALLRGSLKLVEQLQDCLTACSATALASEAREIQLAAVNSELERRCEMAESRSNALFERIKALETEMMEEQSSRQEIQQESSHFQALLHSAHVQGQQVSQQLTNIQGEIEAKEAEIAKLQLDLRRLTSRRVLQEIAPAEDSAAMEIRSLRKERKTASGLCAISGLKEVLMGRNFAPLQSPKGQFIPEAPRVSLLKGQEREVSDLEYHLKCREIDLEAQFSAELEALKSQLVTANTRNQELETALNCKDQSLLPTYSTDRDEHLPRSQLSLLTARVAWIAPAGLKKDKLKQERVDCCSSF